MVGRSRHLSNIGQRGTNLTGGGGGEITGLAFSTKSRYRSPFVRLHNNKMATTNNYEMSIEDFLMYLMLIYKLY